MDSAKEHRILGHDHSIPTYSRLDEIQEYDASGQLVATVTTFHGVFPRESAHSYAESSLTDAFLSKFPEYRVRVSVSFSNMCRELSM
jgi:hypothetical protein